MSVIRRVSALAASATLVFAAATPAVGAGGPDPLAHWAMNEGRSAQTMVDRSHNLNGHIGRAVLTGRRIGGATGYRWSDVDPTAPPVKPERLVVVDDGRLNPGTRNYSVNVRFRTQRVHSNLIQKGQSGSPGGFFKIEFVRGRVTCLFRGLRPNGSLDGGFVSSGRRRVNNGSWHVVTCSRIGGTVTMSLDGRRVDVNRRLATGVRIANRLPLTIAGKRDCDQRSVDCDYFSGAIDYVRIGKG